MTRGVRCGLASRRGREVRRLNKGDQPLSLAIRSVRLTCSNNKAPPRRLRGESTVRERVSKWDIARRRLAAPLWKSEVDIRVLVQIPKQGVRAAA